VGELLGPPRLEYNLPESFLALEYGGMRSRRAISEVDKATLREYSKDHYKTGLVPKALRMDKATPDSLMGKLIQKEIGSMVDIFQIDATNSRLL
jgi:hypothetical protein